MAIFDEFASGYDQWYSEKKGGFIDKIETELALKMLKIKKGMKILDAGCGTGNFSIKLAAMGCRVTGIDISKEMLAIAREKTAALGLDIDFIEMDLNDLKFVDDHFDSVISMAAFEFLTDPKRVLDQFFRVTKTGGNILIGTITGDSLWGEFYQSKPLKENTVFKYADFKTLDDMKGWEKEKLINTGECLFISPLDDETNFTIEREEEFQGKRKGGYICALWQK